VTVIVDVEVVEHPQLRTVTVEVRGAELVVSVTVMVEPGEHPVLLRVTEDAGEV
jgi:hypothetical protein